MAPDFVIVNQVASDEVFELAACCARTLGPTYLVTGSVATATERGLEVHRAPEYSRASHLSRLRSWMAFMRFAAKKLRTIDGTPTVLLYSNPPLAPLLGYLAYHRRGWRYVLQIYDVYPDAIVQQNLLKRRNPIIRAWQYMNRKTYANASTVCTLGPVMAIKVGQYVRDSGAIAIVPTWVDSQKICPMMKAQNPFARQHHQVDKLTVLYSGNLGVTHDITALIAAINLLRDTPKIHFLFVGGGARQGELERLSMEHSNVTHLPAQDGRVLPFSMATGDVAVVTLAKGTEGLSMPSKSYYYMAAGCALLGITHGDNDVSRLITTHRCGASVDVADGPAIAAALRRFATDPAFLAECRANSRRAAVNVYSAETCIAKQLDILRRVHDGFTTIDSTHLTTMG